MTDPWSAPAVIPSTFPSVQGLHGRLVLLTPRKVETVPDTNNPGQFRDRMMVDILVVDGAGPIPVFKQRQHTGQFLEGTDFPGTYMSQGRIINQLREALASGGKVLGRVGLYKEGQPQGQGNPWGLVDPTEQDAQLARQFLATRTVSAAIPQPAPGLAGPVAQPVYTQQTPPAPAAYAQPQATQPVYAQPPQVPATVAPAAPPAPQPLPQPGSAPAGANPFA
jgi:hypothetical protein